MSTPDPPIPPQWDGNRQRQPTRDDVLDLVEFVKSHDDSTTRLQAAIEELAERCSATEIAKAARIAMRETLEDTELMQMATQHFYAGFVAMGRHDGTMWVGAKLLALFSSAMVGFGIWLIWYFGLKK
jgi:hypothetical protein